MQGWVKLHRQIMENEFYFSERFTRTQAWVDLLLLATHKERTLYIRGVEIKLQKGQLCYSQVSLSKRWKWNPRTVLKWLRELSNRQMIHTKKSNVTTIISINKWDLYQGCAEQSAEQNTQQTTQQSADKQECINNGKNGKNILLDTNQQKEDFEKFRLTYPGTKRGLETEFTNFIKKTKGWQNILPTLLTALDNQITARSTKKQLSEFVPEWKHLKTWINNRCWEEEIKVETKNYIEPSEAMLELMEKNNGR